MDAFKKTNRFTVPLFSWDSIDEHAKITFCNLLQLDQNKTKHYFDLYFTKFHLLHKIGHIITHIYDEDHQSKLGRTEYCANLFAYKYLEQKNENEYLFTLTEIFKFILNKHNLTLEINKDYLDNYFVEMQKDFIGYILVHAQLFLDCLKNKMELCEVMECISKHNLKNLNSSVVLQKNIQGKMLVQESKAYIFEMNKIELNIDFAEKNELTQYSLDLQCD